MPCAAAIAHRRGVGATANRHRNAAPESHAREFLQECNRNLGDDIAIDPDTI